MNYKGVGYGIARSTTPGVWNWRFQIGDKVVTGKTETKLAVLAARRVEVRIDRELKSPCAGRDRGRLKRRLISRRTTRHRQA
jgi:hypothetical protein